jgi:hypothetical protein
MKLATAGRETAIHALKTTRSTWYKIPAELCNKWLEDIHLNNAYLLG